MTKMDLVKEVMESTDNALAKKDVELVVNNVFGLMAKALADGEKIAIAGFGTFDIKERAARKGRNPQTGEEIDIAASKSVHFKAGKALKESVNG